MNNEELHIDENLDDQEYLRQQVIETCDKLKEDLGLTWKSIGLLTGKKSGGNFQNVYYGHQTANGDHLKDLKLLLKLLLKVQQFYKGGDNPFNFHLNEDPAVYAPIKKQLDNIEKKLDHTQSIADLLIENQANGNESLKKALEETVNKDPGKWREKRAAKHAKFEEGRKEKESPQSVSKKKNKDNADPTSNEDK